MSRPADHVGVLLVCSTGGHLLQLVALREVWCDASRAWVTFDKSDARSLLADEDVDPRLRADEPQHQEPAPQPPPRASRRRARGARGVVLTTGAGVAVPFAWIGRLYGARVVYVESFTRIEGPSLSCRMIAPVAERVYAQWPELARAMPAARYEGSLFEVRA